MADMQISVRLRRETRADCFAVSFRKILIYDLLNEIFRYCFSFLFHFLLLNRILRRWYPHRFLRRPQTLCGCRQKTGQFLTL